MKQTIILDASQIDTFLECPKKWEYSYSRNIELDKIDKTALNKGTIVHGLLERFYTKIWEKEPIDRALLYCTEQLNEVRKLAEVSDEDFKFLVSKFIFYTQYYSKEDMQIQTIEKDGKKKPAVEVGFSIPIYEDHDFLFILEGRIDLIAHHLGAIRWIDHKTQSRTSDLYKRRPQFLTYSLATNLSGLINYFGLQIDNKAFRRTIIQFQDFELERWKRKVISIFFKILYMKRINNFETRESSCEGRFGYPCQYTKLCEEINPGIINGLISINYRQKEEWKPWRLENES